MILLGDLGGLFGSLLLIGAAFHALTVDNALPVHMLRHYFLVEPENMPLKPSRRHKRTKVKHHDQEPDQIDNINDLKDDLKRLK